MNIKPLIAFIKAREVIRARRERGLKAPWTLDPILQQFHFCNINREDDRVTKWIAANVRKPYGELATSILVTQLLTARIFNDPETLALILPVKLHRISDINQLLHQRLSSGKTIFRGAYMITTHGQPGSVHEYHLRLLATVMGLTWGYCNRLQTIAEQLVQVKGLGDFLVNQVCADLRYCRGGREHWKDWGTFVWGGAGTKRGMNRVLGAPVDAPFSREVLTSRVLLLQRQLYLLLPCFRDPNNVANALCEYDKYSRVQDQIAAKQKPQLKRKYHGNQSS